MSNELFTDSELEDLRSLGDLFSEIEPAVIRHVYLKADRDYRSAQDELAELIRNPALMSKLYMSAALPVSTNANAQGAGINSPSETLRGPGQQVVSGGLAALAMAPPPPEDDSASLLPDLSTFDMNSIADTLTQVGASVSDGISLIANGLTHWVADLASAFDASWGEDSDEKPATSYNNTSARDEPAVGFGTGLASDSLQQRRRGGASSSQQQLPVRPEPEEDDEEELEDDWGFGDEDDHTKDD